MALCIGIVGMPNVGKSTLFNALTGSRAADASNYPFCTIDPNIGIVEVPDERLRRLAEIVHPAKIVPAVIEFRDIAGLVRGAHAGEGLGNAFLSCVREVHTICHVVRGFTGDGVIHVEGTVDPKRDRETIETELCLADLAILDRRTENVRARTRSGSGEAKGELAVLEKVRKSLERGVPARRADLAREEEVILGDLHLLTMKPVIYALNAGEEDLKTVTSAEAAGRLGVDGSGEVIVISAKIEQDLDALAPQEARAFLIELGVTSSGLDRLIRAAYATLRYITFFTAGPKEVRAWTITGGMTAEQAAGVIHSDFARGFIRAETVAYGDFVRFGGEQGAKEAGRMRQEGRDYVVQDGDVLHFRFNV